MDKKSFFGGIWQKWVKITNIIGFYNTKLLTGILFYTVFTFYGIFAKLFRIDILDIRISKDKNSYWKKTNNTDKEPFKQY